MEKVVLQNRLSLYIFQMLAFGRYKGRAILHLKKEKKSIFSSLKALKLF
jgi:hypothetical protein